MRNLLLVASPLVALLLGACAAVRITDFVVPRTVFDGDRALLDCKLDGNRDLQQLKWFFNGEEFFR